MYKTDVIAYFGGSNGGQKNVAAFLGIKPSAVSQWGDLVPEKRASRLAKLTLGRKRNGVVLRYTPELYEKSGGMAKKFMG